MCSRGQEVFHDVNRQLSLCVRGLATAQSKPVKHCLFVFLNCRSSILCYLVPRRARGASCIWLAARGVLFVRSEAALRGEVVPGRRRRVCQFAVCEISRRGGPRNRSLSCSRAELGQVAEVGVADDAARSSSISSRSSRQRTLQQRQRRRHAGRTAAARIR